MASFSNGAELIASCGQHDRLVKIWRRLSYELDNTRFDISYLPHPKTVTELHWRQPWHAEQNLDPLLYTFCSDSQLRLWTYSDPHSLSVMQLIATIDTASSIQPRRLSAGSISRKRYAFVFDSRDFSHATEKTLQRAPSGPVDHALEHLIEVANRSPEICVVLDGLGHMSAWGVENAGCKSRKPAAVFNVALVDDLKARLSVNGHKHEDYVYLCAFATNVFSASMSLLVRTYSGQIDWYESPIAEFFDTSSRENRVRLLSSWSGHDLPIDHIARSVDDDKILSWTTGGQAILWSQTWSGALQRRCEITLPTETVAVVLMGKSSCLVTLQQHELSMWNLEKPHGSKACSVKLKSHQDALRMQLLPDTRHGQTHKMLMIELKEFSTEFWRIWVPADQSKRSRMNGAYQPLTFESSILVSESTEAQRSISCDVLRARSTSSNTAYVFSSIDSTGLLTRFGHHVNDNHSPTPIDVIETGVTDSSSIRAVASGHVALTDRTGTVLTIWNQAQHAYEWQYTFHGPDQIQKLAWTCTHNGQLMLFVGLGHHAVVVGQLRYCASSSSESWGMLKDISLREFTTNYIGDVSWLPSGDLAIGAGNQIFVLECTSKDTTNDQSQSTAGRKQVGEIKTTKIVDYNNTALPIFSAPSLTDLLNQGRFHQLRVVLSDFYNKLKYFVDGDTIDSFLDRQPLWWLRPHDQENGSMLHDDALTVLEDVEDSFQDYLTMTNIWQMYPSEMLQIADLLPTIITLAKQRKSMDDNALHFLQAFLQTPPEEILPWRAFVFASRSTSQEALLDWISRRHDGKITWAIARRNGIFVWLSDQTALQTQFENIARTEYNKQEDRNPVDCSLYYLALNKKSVLQGLWRMTVGVKEKENTMKLLANNFDEPRWKATALKNAYALLSKRRFEYAAAFFLLGGSLKDAVNCCVNQLNDVQLAIAVARVWDKDPSQSATVTQELLRASVLPWALHQEEGRWVAAWVFATLGQMDLALRSITEPLSTVIKVNTVEGDGQVLKSASFRANDPQLLILFAQLREDLIKQGEWTRDTIRPGNERDFVLKIADWLRRAGLHLSALRLVTEWQFVPYQKDKATKVPPAKAGGLKELPHDKVHESDVQRQVGSKQASKKPAPTQFVEPSADSLLDSFGF